MIFGIRYLFIFIIGRELIKHTLRNLQYPLLKYYVMKTE